MIKDFKFAIRDINSKKQYIKCLKKIEGMGISWVNGEAPTYYPNYFTTYYRGIFFSLLISNKYRMIWDNNSEDFYESVKEEHLEVITCKNFLEEHNKKELFIKSICLKLVTK